MSRRRPDLGHWGVTAGIKPQARLPERRADLHVWPLSAGDRVSPLTRGDRCIGSGSLGAVRARRRALESCAEATPLVGMLGWLLPRGAAAWALLEDLPAVEAEPQFGDDPHVLDAVRISGHPDSMAGVV